MKKTKRIAFLSLVLAVLMVASVLPLGMLTASAVTADSSWYNRETTDTTPNVLYVNDATELWAFATVLQGGTNFAGKTVKLNADITVNKGMDIYGGNVENAQKWPLTTSGKKFAGTFDGQGHTISGLYVSGSGVGVGIFGNVATGTHAIVKNVRIENSYVTSSGQGGLGGIFGEVQNETTTTIYPDSHINATKATVSNVYANINVVSTYVCANTDAERSGLGTGGIIGGTRADVEITNTTFVGKVMGTVRGAAAFVGSIRPYEASGKTYYRSYVTIKNSVADAEVTGTAESNGFVGALVGYTNSVTTHTFENVFSTCTLSGKTYVGELVGGGHWTTANYKLRDGVTEDWQEFYFNNVHYLNNLGVANTSVYTAGNPVFGKETNAQKVCNEDKTSHATRAEVIDAIAEAVDDSLKQSLSLKNNLSLNVYAMILDPDAVVTMNGEEVSGNDGRYTLDGILPQQMTDTFALKVSQKILGETVIVRKSMSVRKYCEAFWNKDFTTDAEKDLIADLLRYGKEAQLRDGYNTYFLATDGMDLTGYGSTVNVNEIQTKYAKTETSADYAFKSAALSMDNTLGLRLMFVAADIADLTVSVSVNGSKTQTFDANDFIRWGSAYVVDYNKIYAHQMEAPVTAKLLKNGVEVAALTYSVADYCKAFLADETQADWAVVNAMYAYGLSATAYNDNNRLVVIDGGVSDYVVIYDDANAEARDMALRFARELQKKTGVLLPVKDDTTANGAKEIIIGKADGRSETTTVYNNITSYSGKKYGSRAAIVNSDIVVVAETVTYTAKKEVDNAMTTTTVNKTPELLQQAVDDLLGDIRTHGGDTWGIGLDYSAQIDLPTFNTSDTKKVYYANENNHTLSIEGKSLNYNSYVSALIADGFVEYTTNEINGNLFGTYVKTVNGSNMVAYAAYYPDGTGYKSNYNLLNLKWVDNSKFDVKNADGTITDNITTQNIRITYGPLDFLLGAEEITTDAANVRATPTITQPARAGAFYSASGMCYVIQLLDGRFILIDGGNKSGTAPIYEKDANGNISKTGSQSANDAKVVYDFLCKNAPDGEKPVIAAWFMSHAHGDHYSMSLEFMRNYHHQVELEMVAHNYPDRIACNYQGGNSFEVPDGAAAFNQYVESYYPNAKRWIVHTGQKLYLPGCDIEIFYTPEDFYGMYDNYTWTYTKKDSSGNKVFEYTYDKGECWYNNGNETSIMFRINLGGTTFMVTGDSEIVNCTQVGTRYRDALESDILQTPHHGLNGPELGFYEYVDPKIVLWSIDEFRVANDDRCNGKGSGTSLDGGYMIVNGSALSAAYGVSAGTSGSYYANGWLQTSNWTRSDGSSGARRICGVSLTEHTTIECLIPTGFVPKDPVIVTPMIPLW